jgi:mRNA interferase MazF
MNSPRPVARGDVVLVRFPFTDLSAHKLRPALVVGRPLDADLILAFITSQLRVEHRPAEHLLDPNDPEFKTTGLKAASRIRLDKLATLRRSLIQRRLGNIGPATESAVSMALRFVFEL